MCMCTRSTPARVRELCVHTYYTRLWVRATCARANGHTSEDCGHVGAAVCTRHVRPCPVRTARMCPGWLASVRPCALLVCGACCERAASLCARPRPCVCVWVCERSPRLDLAQAGAERQGSHLPQLPCGGAPAQVALLLLSVSRWCRIANAPLWPALSVPLLRRTASRRSSGEGGGASVALASLASMLLLLCTWRAVGDGDGALAARCGMAACRLLCKGSLPLAECGGCSSSDGGGASAALVSLASMTLLPHTWALWMAAAQWQLAARCAACTHDAASVHMACCG